MTENGKSALVYALPLIVMAYCVIPARAETLTDRMNTIALESGMAKMAAASQPTSPISAQAAVVNLVAKSVGVKNNNAISAAAVPQTANSPLIDTVDESYFQQLQNLYARGTRPSEKNLTGWFAGRCYNHDSPSNPEGALLVGVRAAIGGDNGPLFPPKSDFRIATLVSLTDTDQFDHIDADEESSTNLAISGDFSRWGTAVEIDGALASKYEKGGLEYRIRKYNSFFIGSLVLIRDHAGRKAGSVYAACYYFKKVH